MEVCMYAVGLLVRWLTFNMNICSKNPLNILPKSCKMRPKIDQIGARGYPKTAARSEDEKKRGPFNSLALLGAIFEENGIQDGGQNRQKIIQN